MARPFRHTSSRLILVAASLAVGAAAAPGQARPLQQPPVLTVFTINGGADSVSSAEPSVALTHTVVGATPSEYRVAHRADFAGGSWKPYKRALDVHDWYDATGESCFAPGPSHRVTLYLQVRATVGEEMRVVDGQRQLVPARIESNVLRATICARVVSTTPPDPTPPPTALLTAPLPER
jgi:hypothetical protein